MTTISIEPENIKSVRNAMQIIRLLRESRIVRKQSIINLQFNGFDECLIFVLTDYQEVVDEVSGILNSNQELINNYVELR